MTTIDQLVNRFLTWPVPADVYPDGTPGQPGRTGTNLLTAEQAKQMLAHVLGDVREPHPQTHRLTLETQAAADYATKLLANPNSGWRMARGCSECAWGKVLGCWRCGGR